jgi:hypothetical protein
MNAVKPSDVSLMCPWCGDWLPTQEAYDTWRGMMQTEHVCTCGATKTRDQKQPNSEGRG